MAIQLLEMAGERGHVESLNLLGDIFIQGQEVEPNPELSIKYYTLASKLGSPHAEYNLGIYRSKSLLTARNILWKW